MNSIPDSFPDSQLDVSRLRHLAPTASAVLALIAQFGCAASGQIDDDSPLADNDDSALGDDDTTPAEDDDTTPTDDDDSTPECNDETLGLTETCPAVSCVDIQGSRPEASSDVYWLDLDGDGGTPTVQLRCDMEVDGGGWAIWDMVRAPELIDRLTSSQVYPYEWGAVLTPAFGSEPFLSCQNFRSWINEPFSDFRVSFDCTTVSTDAAQAAWKVRGAVYGCTWPSSDPAGADDITSGEADHISPGCPDIACDMAEAYNSTPVLGLFDVDGDLVGDHHCVGIRPWTW